MNLVDMILNSKTGGVDQVARQFNLAPDQAKSAMSELLGPLTRGLQKNMAKSEGLDGLLGALRNGHHSRYVDQPDSLSEDATREDGNKILGHIFGSKEVSRKVAGEASAKTGVDTGILKKMLPVVASMVMGSMSKQAKAAPKSDGNLLGSLLTSFLGGGQSQQRSAGGGLLGGLLGKIFGR